MTVCLIDWAMGSSLGVDRLLTGIEAEKRKRFAAAFQTGVVLVLLDRS